jgi:predicted ATPase
MLTKLEICNYKSIYDATIELSPFTLLIGANGTGKSNLISLFRGISERIATITSVTRQKEIYSAKYSGKFQKHLKFLERDQQIRIWASNGKNCILKGEVISSLSTFSPEKPTPIDELLDVKIFNLNPSRPGKSEAIVLGPTVLEDGSGVVQVLDSLKTGDREDLFLRIESQLGQYIPEIEKISFISEQDAKRLQVREKYIPKPVPVEMLSEGTKLVLAILTILYQEHPPSLVCIEDIDRGLHPRLFQQIVELCNDLSRKLNIQIIATTHNPYILDEFVGNESAVVIVEKKEGCTTFTTLAERLAQVQDNGEEMPLGAVWYSGLVGGVPKR